MTSSILLFNEHISDASRWQTRTAADASVAPGPYVNAALPPANVFSANPMQVWEAPGVAAAATVKLRLELRTGNILPPPLLNVGAVYGLLNVRAFEVSSGLPLRLRVRFTERPAPNATPFMDKTHDIYVAGASGATLRQTWFLRDFIPPTGVRFTSPDFENLGGQASGVIDPVFVEVDFSVPGHAGGNWTLQMGRIVRMTGLLCDVVGTPQRSIVDHGEVVRSYSGTPFVNRGSRLRRYGAQITGLTDRQVDGVFFDEPTGGANQFQPSINTIARLSGATGEVAFIERYRLPDSSSRWQQQPVFGFFDSELNVSRVASAQGGDEGISEASFSILERPQFTA